MPDIVKSNIKQGIAKIRELAKEIALELSSVDLAKRVAAKTGLSEAESISLLQDTKLESCIHDELASKLTGGAIAISAFNALQKKIEEGNMHAIALALSFNRGLRTNTAKAITNLQVNSQNALIALDGAAKGLLGEKKE